jgi:hypothetical protein
MQSAFPLGLKIIILSAYGHIFYLSFVPKDCPLDVAIFQVYYKKEITKVIVAQ